MMIIMILSYNVSLYGLVLSLHKWFFSLMTLHSPASGEKHPDPHRGTAPGSRWGTSVPQSPCQCPSQTKILDLPLRVHFTGVQRWFITAITDSCLAQGRTFLLLQSAKYEPVSMRHRSWQAGRVHSPSCRTRLCSWWCRHWRSSWEPAGSWLPSRRSPSDDKRWRKTRSFQCRQTLAELSSPSLKHITVHFCCDNYC